MKLYRFKIFTVLIAVLLQFTVQGCATVDPVDTEYRANRDLYFAVIRGISEIHGWRRRNAGAELLVGAHDLRQRIINAKEFIQPWANDQNNFRQPVVRRMKIALEKLKEGADALLSAVKTNDEESWAIATVKLKDGRSDFIGVAARLRFKEGLSLTPIYQREIVQYIEGVLDGMRSKPKEDTASGNTQPEEIWALQAMRADLLSQGDSDEFWRIFRRN